SDFPDDPGCEDISDIDESDDCPTGADCPACGNGVDDDGDGISDYPSDPGCMAAADRSEIDYCIPGVDVTYLPETGTAGTTPPSGSGSNFSPTCSSSTASTEVVFHYPLLRDLSTLSFSTEGSPGDTVLYARAFDCSDIAAEVACAQAPSAGETITIPGPALGDYFVFVDGDFISGIDFVLNVSGTIGLGGPCEPGNSQFTCEGGQTCDFGTATCRLTDCNNGVDDDGDGLIDDLDPGCTSADDDNEAPNPSPPPQCADSSDNDGDGQIDYPADSDCDNAADDDESD
ncbi:MAG: hypothetical protein AAGC55_24860, partial [Myxococcota bacterium]